MESQYQLFEQTSHPLEVDETYPDYIIQKKAELGKFII